VIEIRLTSGPPCHQAGGSAGTVRGTDRGNV